MKQTAITGGLFAAALAVGSLAGCGYQFAGTGNRLPAEIRTVSLGPIQNATREVGIEKQLIESLEDEITSHGRLKVVPTGESDAQMTGIVRYYVSRPVSFNSNDEAQQYQAIVVVDLDLRRRDNGKLLWKAVGQRETQDYSAVPGTVVTSSSQFQRSAVSAKAIPQFTDVQLSESTRREANERLIEQLTREVYNSMMEDF
ncbi:MAG TPA: LPS assembly lipoprotein LptE [Candidatus Binatia bacterium]|nr:LPS assembly lipoprotein LptE [Candidatus Binatia bacterium]